MSLTNAIEMAVKARPGMTTGEIAKVVHKTGDVPRVSALLGQSYQRGKLERQPAGKAFRYYPNQKTGRDQRNGGRTAAPKPAPRPRVAAKPAPAQRPLANPAPPPKPSPEQVAKLSAIFTKPSPRLKPVASAQTVEEFLAAGGVIQRLPQHHSANPLRYDHSDTTAPIGRRRPTVHARKAATA